MIDNGVPLVFPLAFLLTPTNYPMNLIYVVHYNVIGGSWVL